jgi:hypothetical protein
MSNCAFAELQGLVLSILFRCRRNDFIRVFRMGMMMIPLPEFCGEGIAIETATDCPASRS